MKETSGGSKWLLEGVAVGIIFNVIFGQTKTIRAVVYGGLIGIGFMIGPAVKAMGIGILGIEYMLGYKFLSW